jgi:hypothetical protein
MNARQQERMLEVKAKRSRRERNLHHSKQPQWLEKGSLATTPAVVSTTGSAEHEKAKTDVSKRAVETRQTGLAPKKGGGEREKHSKQKHFLSPLPPPSLTESARTFRQWERQAAGHEAHPWSPAGKLLSKPWLEEERGGEWRGSSVAKKTSSPSETSLVSTQRRAEDKVS